jgi:DNA-binding LacI/PurR family transcriptional regulator
VEPVTPLVPKERKAAYRRIAESLRGEIMSGRREAGVQLPSTNDLATLWKSSPYTVHTALTTLVKEGWLERLNGDGTYVVDPGKRFVRAGIYHAVDICSNEHPAFVRNIHTALLEQFAKLGKETQVFMDTRPIEQQVELLPTLQKALEERTIQCLVAPSLSRFGLPAISKIKIPTAFLGNPESTHKIESDIADMFSRGARHLAAQGCRSIGIISSISPATDDRHAGLYRQFEEAIRAEGLLTRPEWIRQPPRYFLDREYDSYGYGEFHRLWQLEEKPEALIVYPDNLVRGLITAALEIGINAVPPRMKFVLHRNARIAQLCPFPVTWAVSDEDAWAGGLVRIIEKQFSGEKISPVLLPFELQENVPPAR